MRVGDSALWLMVRPAPGRDKEAALRIVGVVTLRRVGEATLRKVGVAAHRRVDEAALR